MIQILNKICGWMAKLYKILLLQDILSADTISVITVSAVWLTSEAKAQSCIALTLVPRFHETRFTCGLNFDSRCKSNYVIFNTCTKHRKKRRRRHPMVIFYGNLSKWINSPKITEVKYIAEYERKELISWAKAWKLKKTLMSGVLSACLSKFEFIKDEWIMTFQTNPSVF